MHQDHACSAQEQPRRLIPVTQWNDHHAWPPQGGLRHLACVRRVGRRVLIDEAAFFAWADTQD